MGTYSGALTFSIKLNLLWLSIINYINISIDMKLQLTKFDQFFLTIPKQIVLVKGWEKGIEIKYKINEKGELVLFS